MPRLPRNWVWSSFNQLGLVSGGVTKNAKRDQLPIELPYLRVANVGDGDLITDRIERIRLTRTEVERVTLEVGDLLIVEGNGSIDQIGRSAIWDGRIKPCVHQNHLIKVRFTDPSIARWAQAWLRSPFGRIDLERKASSTSGLHTLSISKVESLVCPLPPLNEMQAAQDLLGGYLAAQSEMFAETRDATASSMSLRQSILAAAFRGELVA